MAASFEIKDGPDAIYRDALQSLASAGVPFLVGGAYALEVHTGVVRRTKDIDLFVMPGEIHRALQVLSDAGYRTELTFPHWIGKAYLNDHTIDLIFNSGNGICRIDREWFEYATPGTVLGLAVLLCPAEETLWQKSFILERDRCDSADVAHLLRAKAANLDWHRLLRRFGDRWRVLLAQLVLFGFIFPGERGLIPQWVTEHLTARLLREEHPAATDEQLCQGTLLSATQYLEDLAQGFIDGRQVPHGNMTEHDVALWTANFHTVVPSSPA